MPTVVLANHATLCNQQRAQRFADANRSEQHHPIAMTACALARSANDEMHLTFSANSNLFNANFHRKAFFFFFFGSPFTICYGITLSCFSAIIDQL
jgi:hypothetical protein